MVACPAVPPPKPPRPQAGGLPDMPRQYDRPLSSPRSRWGELKRQRAVSLTDHAWDLVGATAEEQAYSRSELLERLIRTHLSAPDPASDPEAHY